MNPLSISISISIFLKDFLSISIFSELPYRYRFRYRYFPELPYRYRYRYFQKWPYRYRYFSKVSIYRQSIFDIDISNRARVAPNQATNFVIKTHNAEKAHKCNPCHYILYHAGNLRTHIWGAEKCLSNVTSVNIHLLGCLIWGCMRKFTVKAKRDPETKCKNRAILSWKSEFCAMRQRKGHIYLYELTPHFILLWSRVCRFKMQSGNL